MKISLLELRRVTRDVPDTIAWNLCGTRVAKCDADALKNQGKDTAALVDFERSMACQSDPALYPVLVLASRKAGNVAKAKLYFARLPASRKPALAGRCAQSHVQLP